MYLRCHNPINPPLFIASTRKITGENILIIKLKNVQGGEGRLQNVLQSEEKGDKLITPPFRVHPYDVQIADSSTMPYISYHTALRECPFWVSLIELLPRTTNILGQALTTVRAQSPLHGYFQIPSTLYLATECHIQQSHTIVTGKNNSFSSKEEICLTSKGSCTLLPFKS